MWELVETRINFIYSTSMMNMYKIKCKRDVIYWIRLTFPNTMLKTVMMGGDKKKL